MDFNNLAACMGTLFLLMATGFLCNKAGLLKPEANKMLSRLIINVSMSAMIVDSIVNTDINLSPSAAAELAGSAAAYYGVLFLLSLLFSKTVARNRPDSGVYQFMVLFGNIGFLGFPLISSLFGEGALFYAAIYNIPFNVLVYTYGVVLISGKRDADSLKKTLHSAPVISAVAALTLLVLGVRLPAFLSDAVGSLGAMTVPGAMLVVGSSLANLPGRELLREWRVYVLAAFTLLLRPVAVWAVLRLFLQDPLILGVSVVLSAVPAAANTTVLCIEYNSNEGLASFAVFITTIVSMLTMPLVAILLL